MGFEHLNANLVLSLKLINVFFLFLIFQVSFASVLKKQLTHQQHVYYIMKKIILLGFISMMNVLFSQEITTTSESTNFSGFSIYSGNTETGQILIQDIQKGANISVDINIWVPLTITNLGSIGVRLYSYDVNGGLIGEPEEVSFIGESFGSRYTYTPVTLTTTASKVGTEQIGVSVFNTNAHQAFVNVVTVNTEQSGVNQGDGDNGSNSIGSSVFEESDEDTSYVVLRPKYTRVGIGFDNPTHKLSVAGNGYFLDQVGIGITTDKLPDGYTLGVNGGIIATKVKVAIPGSTEWPDYVFSTTYELKTLEEVAVFVEKNKHLPGVPSADVVAKEGYDVSEMDAKLLEKIEELTLYMIEIKKENEALKKEVKALKQ